MMNYNELLQKYESLKNQIHAFQGNIGICKTCEIVGQKQDYIQCNYCEFLYCSDCSNICYCDAFVCYNCTNCKKGNCMRCCITCKTCNKCNCNSLKICYECRASVCENCVDTLNNFTRKCETMTDSCNSCHYKKECVQCWDVTQYKLLPDQLKILIYNFMISLKISKLSVPKPIINIILHHIVKSNSNVFIRKITFKVIRRQHN